MHKPRTVFRSQYVKRRTWKRKAGKILQHLAQTLLEMLMYYAMGGAGASPAPPAACGSRPAAGRAGPLRGDRGDPLGRALHPPCKRMGLEGSGPVVPMGWKQQQGGATLIPLTPTCWFLAAHGEPVLQHPLHHLDHLREQQGCPRVPKAGDSSWWGGGGPHIPSVAISLAPGGSEEPRGAGPGRPCPPAHPHSPSPAASPSPPGPSPWLPAPGTS